MIEVPATIHVVDSHTEGEPTRVIVGGWPAPNGATIMERRDSVRRDHDHLRRAVVCEPRGHAAIVGTVEAELAADGAVTIHLQCMVGWGRDAIRAPAQPARVSTHSAATGGSQSSDDGA